MKNALPGLPPFHEGTFRWLRSRAVSANMSVPIPPEIFERMSRLNRDHDIELRSTYSGDTRTGWRVRVAPRDNNVTLPIVVFGPRLREVLEEALVRADAMGWMD